MPAHEPPDLLALARDLDALHDSLRHQRGPADVRQLRALNLLSWALVLGGLALSLLGLNPLSPLLIALGAGTRWMIVAHHVAHGAVDGIAGLPPHWHSRRFARGMWRWLQWPDWIEVAAWQREHNQLHHAYTNEAADPDLVESQAQWLRESGWPMPLRYAMALVLASTWRWLYYAPNTSICLEESLRRGGIEPLLQAAPRHRPWSPWTPAGRRLWLNSWLPFAVFQFVLLPALLLPFGWHAAAIGLLHCVLGEWLTNLYTFVVIVPNHAGDDLLRFADRGRGRGAWYWRQIGASVNYRTGHPLNDWLHGWLNYQIEHHLWPDLTPRQYALAAPQVQAICARHGITYAQQSVWNRLGKMLQIMTGSANMRQQAGQPEPATAGLPESGADCGVQAPVAAARL